VPVPEHGCRQNHESCQEDKEHLAEHPTLTERPFLRWLWFLRESGCFTRLACGVRYSGCTAFLDDAYLFLSESHWYFPHLAPFLALPLSLADFPLP
jgi:hypothetical protein